MAAFDEQEYTKSFDLKIWKRLTRRMSRPTLISMCMEFRLKATTDSAWRRMTAR